MEEDTRVLYSPPPLVDGLEIFEIISIPPCARSRVQAVDSVSASGWESWGRKWGDGWRKPEGDLRYNVETRVFS